MPTGWIHYVRIMADRYKVDPYVCLALAKVESSNPRTGEEFRFGKTGMYYMPYGVHQRYMDRWNVSDPYVNTEVGIRALSIHLSKTGSLYKALGRYNTGDKGSKFERYYKGIKNLAARYKKDKVFSRGKR
jgi:soluble lytic murein transglycosylase-like protein